MIDDLNKDKSNKVLTIFDSFLKHTNRIINIHDKHGRYIIFSEKTQDILGLTKEEIEGKSFSELLPPETAEIFYQRLERLKKYQTAFTVEDTISTDEGKRIYESMLFPVEIVDGHLEIFGSIAWEVTEHRNTEEQYRRLLESTNAILWEYDLLKDVWTYISPQIEKILGYSPEEWTNLDFWINRIHPEDRQWAVEFCKRHTAAGEPHSFEYRFNTKAGNIVYIKEDCNVEISQGKPVKIRGSMLDITSQKLAAEKANYFAKEAEIKQKQIDEELEKARQIHERTLLGKFSKVSSSEDISLEAHYHPAERIGGDFYNFVRTEDKLIIYLSDVTGHGIEAAIISTFVKETIENYVELEAGKLTPEEILTHVYKQYIKDDFPDDYFICLFIAVLDQETYELNYTAAGMHFPPFVKLADGSCVRLQSEGPPISGAIGEELMDFSADSVTLTPGSIVLFYTDGIAEQRNEDNGVYGERLEITFFSQSSKFPPELLKQVINHDFVDFNGSLQGDDDITYVILQINPPERKQYHWQLNSNLQELEKFYSKIFPFIRKYVNEEAILGGLYELLVNAVEHGNKFDANKKVYVCLVLTNDYVFATVEDEGEGFNWKEKMAANTQDIITSEEERGRGVLMARMLCDRLFYNEKGNKAFLILESKA